MNNQLRALGWFHFFHSPCLVLYPLLFKNKTGDVFYVAYFFLIMFSYTFLNGECPISYIAKRVKCDNNAGTFDYPEMKYIFSVDEHGHYYFGVMTGAYVLTLFNVILRTEISLLYLAPAFLNLAFYFMFLRFKPVIFIPFQKVTQVVMITTVCLILAKFPR